MTLKPVNRYTQRKSVRSGYLWVHSKVYWWNLTRKEPNYPKNEVVTLKTFLESHKQNALSIGSVHHKICNKVHLQGSSKGEKLFLNTGIPNESKWVQIEPRFVRVHTTIRSQWIKWMKMGSLVLQTWRVLWVNWSRNGQTWNTSTVYKRVCVVWISPFNFQTPHLQYVLANLSSTITNSRIRTYMPVGTAPQAATSPWRVLRILRILFLFTAALSWSAKSTSSSTYLAPGPKSKWTTNRVPPGGDPISEP